MDNITTIILAVFASTGFWQLLQKIYETHKKTKTPQEKMLLAIGRDRLLFLSKKYEQMGYIPDDEYENYDEMGEAYIALGGNSQVKKHYQQDVKLPVR